MRFVSSNTNYVEVNDGQGIIQTAFTNFVYNWSPNGLGGVTVQGNVNGISMRQDKDGNVYYNYGINGIAVSATVSIVLTGGTNQASVTINPNFSGNTLTMNGYLVPYNESSVFQGTHGNSLRRYEKKEWAFSLPIPFIYYYSIGNVSCLLITLTEVVIPIPIKTF